MNPIRFVELAREMVTRSQASRSATAEAERRSAISRAYYSAFHVAVECLSTLGIEPTKASRCHVMVRNGLNNCGDAAIASIGAELANLYTSRLKADYNLGDAKISTTAAGLTTRAEELIARIRSEEQAWRADAAKRAALATAILSWAKSAGQPLFAKK